MEGMKVMTCGLCLNELIKQKLTEIDDVIEEVLGAFNLDLHKTNGGKVICNDCSAKLYAAFDFKATCLNIENKISAYIESDKTHVDLTDIYMEETGDQIENTSHTQICRFCMQLINGDCLPAEEIFDSKMMTKYLPEINFNISKDPVICCFCHEEFSIHTNFLMKCLDLREIRRPVNIEAGVALKTEEIKSEYYENNGDNFEESYRNPSLHESNESIIKNEPGIGISPEPQNEINHIEESKSDLVDQNLPDSIPTIVKDKLDHQMYKCDECDYQTMTRSRFLQHRVRHKHCWELRLYKCDECDYKSVRKSSISKHQHQNHRKQRPYQVLKCDKCRYMTSYKNCLLRHQERKHKDSLLHYKCDMCEFQTKQEITLKRHRLKHVGPSEGRFYKCDQCTYKSLYKYLLVQHWRKTNFHLS